MLTRIAPLATAFILCAGPAFAQQPSPCAPYEIVSAALAEKYHEAPVSRFLSDRGFVIEVLASADGATVTVLGIQAGGHACILATGSTFAVVPAAAPGSAS